ncbi:class I SAM-dependent methyltransferase [Bosea sp. BK604]|uniref:class I SAM-dependent methyltransferase n=1 Tax=Bosea sp. BK604 TaxID=2512180 RepID=UPI0010505233|nr:class I SAM-dependent methyltransferase [Bosea sp. BK604]
MAAFSDGRDDFDAALIPGMRTRLEEGYRRFRAAERVAMAQNAPPAAGGLTGNYFERNCPNCAAPAPGEAALQAHGLDVINCPSCRMTYTRQVMDEAADAVRYQASEIDDEAMNLHSLGAFLELESTRARYYLDRIGGLNPQMGSMLEIGCGSGTFIVEAGKRGWDTLGIEPSTAAAALARRRGAKVVEGYFPRDVPADRRLFQTIAVLDVLEHFAYPRRLLAAVRDYLEPGGRLFIQVPNWDSLLVQLEGATSSTVCPGHWSYFTPQTLADMLAREGYRAVFVETVVSELDRVAHFSKAEQLATIKRLRPSAEVTPPAGGSNFMTEVVLTPAQLHGLKLGYKLIGLFERS